MTWNMQQATGQIYSLAGAASGRLFHKTLLTFQKFGKKIFSFFRDIPDEHTIR